MQMIYENVSHIMLCYKDKHTTGDLLFLFRVSFAIVSVVFTGGDRTHKILMCSDVILFKSKNFVVDVLS